jgi:hypothetical protein
MTYTPTQFLSPLIWATNGGSTGKTMDFDNVGTAKLYVKVTDPAPTYVNIADGEFNIIEAGPTHTVGLTFNGAGLTDTLIIDSLKVESNDGEVGGPEVYSDVRWIRYHMVVTTNYYYAEFDTCPYSPITQVSNIGNLGSDENDSLGMFYNGNNYLFEFTPVFVTDDINGSGPVGFTWLHEHHDYIAEDHLQSTIYDKLDVAVYKDKLALVFPPRRTDHYDYHKWWGYWTKYSKVIQLNPRYVLVYNWWVWNPPFIWWDDLDPVLNPDTNPKGGYFGIGADWDVTGDASSRNLGGYDDTRNLIWQYSDSAGFENYYGGFKFLDAWVWESNDSAGTVVHETGPWSARVGTNETQLYPFNGYDGDSLYKYMSTPGWSVESDSSQDMNITMCFVEKLDPTPSTVIFMKYALLVSDQGEAGFRGVDSLIVKMKAGDANKDGGVSVSDVVYLINFLFKGGTAPYKAYSDANGDANISVSDVVYLINYLFKGGTAPKLVWCQLTPPW